MSLNIEFESSKMSYSTQNSLKMRLSLISKFKPVKGKNKCFKSHLNKWFKIILGNLKKYELSSTFRETDWTKRVLLWIKLKIIPY